MKIDVEAILAGDRAELQRFIALFACGLVNEYLSLDPCDRQRFRDDLDFRAAHGHPFDAMAFSVAQDTITRIIVQTNAEELAA